MVARLVCIVLCGAGLGCVERAIDPVGQQSSVSGGPTAPAPDAGGGDGGPRGDGLDGGASDPGVACGAQSCPAAQMCCPRSGVQSWACQPSGGSCAWGKPVLCDGAEDCRADQLCLGHIAGVADDWGAPPSEPTWTRCWDTDRPFDIKLEICHEDAGCTSGRCELHPTPPGAPRLGHCF